MKLSTIGLEAPDDFPFQGYEKIHAAMVIQKDVSPKKWSEFAGAWNSVAYKFIALAQNDENYTVSIKRGGGGASSYEERYNQEYALFNFFVVGDALLESLFYSLYVIASTKNPKEFPMTSEQIQNVSPTMLRDKLKKYYKNEPITEYLGEIVASTEYQNLNKIRNTLIHRTMPSRTINLSTDRKIPDTWMIDNIPTDDQLTASRRIWYSKVVSKLIDLMNEFILR
jgi:hypothetical protein